jgi:hypothetical protein
MTPVAGFFADRIIGNPSAVIWAASRLIISPHKCHGIDDKNSSQTIKKIGFYVSFLYGLAGRYSLAPTPVWSPKSSFDEARKRVLSLLP